MFYLSNFSFVTYHSTILVHEFLWIVSNFSCTFMISPFVCLLIFAWCIRSSFKIGFFFVCLFRASTIVELWNFDISFLAALPKTIFLFCHSLSGCLFFVQTSVFLCISTSYESTANSYQKIWRLKTIIRLYF